MLSVDNALSFAPISKENIELRYDSVFNVDYKA